MSYELIDHTADTGLDIEAESPEKLFEDAFHGMMEVLGFRDVPCETTRTIELDPSPLDLMLVEWLREILARYESDQFVTGDVSIQSMSEENGLRGELRGAPFDPERHDPATEIKGVTYHGLSLEQTGDRWQARVIFDL